MEAGGVATASLTVVVAAYPASLRLAGTTTTGGAILAYQLFRRPNHGLEFYPTSSRPRSGGHRRRRAVRHGPRLAPLHLAGDPAVDLDLVRSPSSSCCRSRATSTSSHRHAARRARRPVAPRWPVWPSRDEHAPRLLTVAVVAIVAAISLMPTVQQITSTERDTALAGSRGLPGGHELGHGSGEHARGRHDDDDRPSMSNIVKWYGHRNSLGLSESPTRCTATRSTTPLPTLTSPCGATRCSSSSGTASRPPGPSSSRTRCCVTSTATTAQDVPRRGDRHRRGQRSGPGARSS